MKPLPIVIAPLLFAVAVVAATPKSNSASPSANATTQELPLPQLKQSEREKYEKETLNGLPQLSPRKLSDLFELHVEHGDLVIKPTARPTERSRVQLDGFNGQSIIMIGVDQANPNANKGAEAATYVYFEHHDFARPDEVYRSVQVMATGTTLQLAGDVSLPREGGRNVQLILNYANKDDPVEAAARLYVQVIAPVSEDVTKIDLTGNNFADLRQRYPLETHTWIAPLVRMLHQESVLAPDPQQATQVLGGAGEAQADPQLVQRVNAALAKFDAPDFKTRQRAAKDLAAIGQPAANYLARADRGGWSVDKANGVDAFLEQFHAIAQADVSELRRTPAFLIDCLYSPDATIRSRAAAELQKLSPRDVKIDPNAEAPQRDAVIDKLYVALVKPAATTQPTTKP